MTKPRLKSVCKRWLTALRLNEWEVDLEFVPDAEALEGCDGTAEWQTEYKHVLIKLAADQTDEELEETLVHELLHVLLEAHKPHPRVQKYDALYERGLNVLSDLLTSRKRRKKSSNG